MTDLPAQPAPAAQRLLLIDGHSMAFRAFYALPDSMMTSTGQVTNAVTGFVNMLTRLIRTQEPTHVAVAFDISRHSFRTQMLPQYKGTRGATPEAFSGQVPLIKEVLDAMHIPHLALEGFEADDILATWATVGAQQGMDVLVCSGDRDTLQLVTDQVTVLYPVKGVTELAHFTPQAVMDKYGVPPQQYPDIAALVGETSDNIPGVPGVGPKTAVKWLLSFGSLDAVLEGAATISGKVGQSLRDHIDQVRLNRTVNALVTDVQLPIGPQDAQLVAFDRQAVSRLADALQWGNRREEILSLDPGRLQAAGLAGGMDAAAGQELAGSAASDQQADFSMDSYVSGQFSAWLDRYAPTSSRSALVVDAPAGSNSPADSVELVLVCEAQPEQAAEDQAATSQENAASSQATNRQALALPLAAMSQDDRQALATWLANPLVAKVVHQAKAAWHVLAAQGLHLSGVAFDTELAAYLLNPDQRGYSLADEVLRNLDRDLEAADHSSGHLFDMADALSASAASPESETSQDSETSPDVPLSQQAGSPAAGLAPTAHQQALAAQGSATLDLADVFHDKLVQRKLDHLLEDLELPVQGVLEQMEQAGIAADGQYLRGLADQFAQQAAHAQQEAFAAIGREVNLASPKQLQEVLFTQLGMPKTKKTKTGYTTDAAALADLFASTQHPFLANLLAHRDVTKLKQTVDGLLKAVQPDGRIHTTFQQTIAATGRLSSMEPNLQNIPIRTEAGRQIRRAFVVDSNYDTLLTADYSQIEMRIMAHLSGDEGLIEAFRSGEDLHRYVGSRVFNVLPSEVTGAMRSQVKAMSYGLAYGLSSFGLSGQLGISPGEAQGLMDDYFTRFGGVRTYLESVVEQARVTGWTQTLLGRRRYLPDLTSDNKQRRAMAERMALNAPIQGSAADIIKLAMLKVSAALEAEQMRSRLLLQVHDELVVEVAPGERDAATELLRREMQGAYQLLVPLDVSVGTGPNWHDAGHG